MKYLAILFILASCVTTTRTRPQNHNETLKDCVEELIGTFGVEPTESLEICERVYRRE